MKTSLFPALGLAGALALAACSITTEPSGPPPQVGGYATVYASDVPPDVYSYPRAEYDGGYAYYVHDHWYYPARGGWVRFESEPAPLYRHRQQHHIEPVHVERRGEEHREYRHDEREQHEHEHDRREH